VTNKATQPDLKIVHKPHVPPKGDPEPPTVKLKKGEILRYSRPKGPWRVWGRDHLGLYSVEV